MLQFLSTTAYCLLIDNDSYFVFNLYLTRILHQTIEAFSNLKFWISKEFQIKMGGGWEVGGQG